MIDIHHHLLFGLDDGSPDVETSVAMLDAAADDGITHIVCTPHSNDRYQFDPEVNQQKLDILRQASGDRVTLGLGCDFHLSYDNIQDALKNPTRYTINQKNYLLVEFADLMIPPTTTETFYELSLAGMRPIITHPERNPLLQRKPERLIDWLRGGALIQVTAASLNGRFGKVAQSMAQTLLAQNWVHFIATDAHNLTSRPPIMSEAYQWIEKRHGRETAERLCVSNPRAVFYGEAWPLQPEPEGVNVPLEVPKPKGLLARLFSS
ncbi:tyrosine-protein phosphatase [Acidipila rosea]|uniref:protein-tyrosine-phosphatase n=1 Tax=Acidipila rosea TaxID=768535 RepID=A0A4R1LC70_9BACT|nr:CpsB/CapC family capsule biosynthesis tyrosine phosphatase [Acidipila rosea]MBW4043817.1 exopolysaccharide biosynthesis protein [Acidobacteriota bacterium]TCK74119.1 protein-tyrosine phosphatase [Acidipila rosea]